MNNGLILTELMTKHTCHVNMYVFTTVSTSLVKQYSELGLRRPEPLYIYACWLTLVMFLNLHCCGSIAQFWKLCISCLQILSWPKLAPFCLVEIELAITSWESKNCKGKGSRKGVVVRALEPGSNSGVDAICGWVVFGSLLCPKRFFFRYPGSPIPSRTEKINK